MLVAGIVFFVLRWRKGKRSVVPVKEDEVVTKEVLGKGSVGASSEVVGKVDGKEGKGEPKVEAKVDL